MLKKQTLLARQTTSPYLSDSGCQRHRWFSCESTEQLVHFSMVTGSCYCLSCQPILEREMRERERGVGEMGEKGERWDN